MSDNSSFNVKNKPIEELLVTENNSESFWLDKAEQVLAECIKLCRLYNNGYVTFIITGEMIDETPEVGSYTFQIRLLDDEQYSRITIPEVVGGIEIREPIVIEDVPITATITYDEVTQTLNVNEEAISYNEPTKTLYIKGLNL